MLGRQERRRREGEVELRPAAPLTGLEHDLPALDLDHGRVGLAVAMDQKLDGRRPAES